MILVCVRLMLNVADDLMNAHPGVHVRLNHIIDNDCLFFDATELLVHFLFFENSTLKHSLGNIPDSLVE